MPPMTRMSPDRALGRRHGWFNARRSKRSRGSQPASLASARSRIRLALDDLGAGYAGLSSFALLEPEVVKVDMSLVRGVHESPMKQKLFRSFTTICRDLNTEIIPEGVEVAEERDCLSKLVGDLYQGYLFARSCRGFASPIY